MIVVSRALHDFLAAEARAAYPDECCGLLVGRARDGGGVMKVTRAVPSRNVTTGSPRHSFEVDPAVRLRLMRALRGTDEAIVGHYHSHPDGPARPSAHDVACTFEPELLWLIIAVGDGLAVATGAFLPDLQAETFRAEVLDIEN
jgi:proteasome lid subunit RPN8/RPN11